MRAARKKQTDDDIGKVPRSSLLTRWGHDLINFLFGYDYFIAHRTVDGQTYAVHLCEQLIGKDNELNCFLDVKYYEAGGQLRWMQTRALANTTRLIVVVTERAHDPGTHLLNEIREFRRLHPNGKIAPIGTLETLSPDKKSGVIAPPRDSSPS